jgi:hypothetical protein
VDLLLLVQERAYPVGVSDDVRWQGVGIGPRSPGAGVGCCDQLSRQRGDMRVARVRQVSLIIAAANRRALRREAEDVFPRPEQREVVVRAGGHVRVECRTKEHGSDAAAAGREEGLTAAASRCRALVEGDHDQPAVPVGLRCLDHRYDLGEERVRAREPAGTGVRAVGTRTLARACTSVVDGRQ